MAAVKSKLLIEQGADFSVNIDMIADDGTPLDLTGYSGASQLRKHYSSLNSHPFTVTVGGNTGLIVLSMTRTQTANISPGIHVFDCEITSGNTTYRVAEGQAIVKAQVTR